MVRGSTPGRSCDRTEVGRTNTGVCGRPHEAFALPCCLNAILEIVAERDAFEWRVRKRRDAARQRGALCGHVRQTQWATARAPWLGLLGSLDDALAWLRASAPRKLMPCRAARRSASAMIASAWAR